MGCFIKLRVPRTKSEIAANARRKDLLSNFRTNIATLKAGDLDDMDYRRALDTLRNEFRTDEESLARSEALSILSYDD